MAYNLLSSIQFFMNSGMDPFRLLSFIRLQHATSVIWMNVDKMNESTSRKVSIIKTYKSVKFFKPANVVGIVPLN